MPDNFLSNLHATLQEQGKEQIKARTEWNRLYPPSMEVSFIYCDEPATYGLWVVEDDEFVYFGIKTPSNRYDPRALTKVPVDIINAFTKLLEHFNK